MKKIKNFIENRSKVLFLSSLISVLLFILILPKFLYYSDYIKHIANQDNINMSITVGEVIWSTNSTEIFKEFSLIFSCILVFICLFNLVGYIYRKNEFIFISIGLSVMITCMSIYVTNIIFIISIMLATILNIIGYIEQCNLNKEDE